MGAVICPGELKSITAFSEKGSRLSNTRELQIPMFHNFTVYKLAHMWERVQKLRCTFD